MPLLFDMTWDDLQTYEGSNPKPADFDDFWERGLAEVESIDPAPQARCACLPNDSRRAPRARLAIWPVCEAFSTYK